MKLKKLGKLLSSAQAERTKINLLSDDSYYNFNDLMYDSRYKPLRHLTITQLDSNKNGQLTVIIDDTVLNND